MKYFFPLAALACMFISLRALYILDDVYLGFTASIASIACVVAYFLTKELFNTTKK